MGCGIVRDKDRNPVGWICGEGITPCTECGDPSDYLCDFPVGKGKRCDLSICGFHACQIGENKHLCPIHTAMYKATGAPKLIPRGKPELAYSLDDGPTSPPS